MSDPGREAVAALPHVSRETLARLDILAERLRRWSTAINLVAPSTVPDLWRRHILDALQLWPLAGVASGSWADLGAGAGFPGLPIAAVAADLAPDLEVTLVDSDGRKCAFVADAARAMGLTVAVCVQRLEAPPPARFAVVSARALAPLPKLLALAEPWLAQGGVALFPKGAGHRDELTAALGCWHAAVRTTPSATDPAGVVLSMREIRRAAS